MSDQSGAQPFDACGAASLAQVLARESGGHPLDVVTELVHVGNVRVQVLADLEAAAQDSRGTGVGFAPRGRAMASAVESELDAADAGEQRGDGEPGETIDVDHTIVAADDGRTHRALTRRCGCCFGGWQPRPPCRDPRTEARDLAVVAAPSTTRFHRSTGQLASGGAPIRSASAT